MIPVMIGGVIFLDKRYSLLEVVSVFVIAIGLIGISMSDKFAENAVDALGLGAIILSLVCDAVASNLQEKAFSTYGAPQPEVIFMVYSIGALFLAVPGIILNDIPAGISKCAREPKILVAILMLAAPGAIGVQFIFLVIKKFGSLLATMITSLRKGFTVAISFAAFGNKKFTLWHGVSIACVFAGIGLNVLAKRKPKKEPLVESEPAATDRNNLLGSTEEPHAQEEGSGSA
jgi:drug/metabolite transporter (DMT)-like permease